MKKIIREEGRDARNLLYWTVPPVQDKASNGLYGRSKSETRLASSDGLRHGFKGVLSKFLSFR